MTLLILNIKQIILVMKQSSTFDSNPMQLKRKVLQNCMLCNIKYTIFSRQHICKRCYRSVCDDCSGNKTLIWNDSFKQQNHRLCKACKVESDAIKNYVKTERLIFAVDSDLAKKWKKGVLSSEQTYRNAKKSLQFTEELLNQLWNSLTYPMKDFVGSVLGDNPQSKLQNVLKQMKFVLNELNSRTEMRIQTAAYIVLLLLCYCSSTTAIQLSLFLTIELRKCQAERQAINDALKDLNCSPGQIKSMEDYIDQRMRKFISVLGMNVLESSLVQNILQDIFQTPQSVVLMYAAILGTQKKMVIEKKQDKNLIDITLLREGNVSQIKKNYNRIRNKAIKKKERKNSKKDNEQYEMDPTLVKREERQKSSIDTKSESNIGMTNMSSTNQKSVEQSPKPSPITKTQSYLEQTSQPSFANGGLSQSAVQRTISNINPPVTREFGDEWKITERRKRNEKTGSYMDLGLEFQLKLRQMKSLGLQTVVSAKETRRVHRIHQPFDFNRKESEDEEILKDLCKSNSYSIEYENQEDEKKDLKPWSYINDNDKIPEVLKKKQTPSSTKTKKDEQYSDYTTSTTKKLDKPKSVVPVNLLVPAALAVESQKAEVQENSNIKKQTKVVVRQQINISPSNTSKILNNKTEVEQKQRILKNESQLKQNSKKQKILQQQTYLLKQKLKFYEKILPQKQTMILQYQNKQKKEEKKEKEPSPQINRYKLESKNLNEKILKLERQNQRLEKQRSRLESQSVLNRSSVPSDREISPENQMNISVYSSSKTVGRDGKSSIQSASELKKQLKLLEFTLKQKNEYIQMITLQNKKLLKDFENQKKAENRKVELIKEEYQNKIADLQLDKTKLKYQNQRLMKKLEEMTLNILSLESQLYDENKKQFEYQ